MSGRRKNRVDGTPTRLSRWVLLHGKTDRTLNGQWVLLMRFLTSNLTKFFRKFLENRCLLAQILRVHRIHTDPRPLPRAREPRSEAHVLQPWAVAVSWGSCRGRARRSSVPTVPGVTRAGFDQGRQPPASHADVDRMTLRHHAARHGGLPGGH